jgi:Zn-dependent protease with chaperone function
MPESLPAASEFTLPTFQEYLSGRGPGSAAAPVGATTPYAVPLDRAIIERLSRSTLQHATNRLVDLVIQYVLTPLLLNSIPVASRSFPRLHALRARAAATLGIPVPDMYAAQQPQIAAIFTAGTDERNVVFVETTYEHLATEDEMLFVVGHECGHIANQHVTYHTLALILMNTGKEAGLLSRNPTIWATAKALELFVAPTLFAWSRRSELTADRAGLICCQDLRVAQRALVRAVLGFASETEVDVEDYLRTYRDTPLTGSTARYSLLDLQHPVIPVRLQALQAFHDSELYYEVTGLPRPDKPLLARDALEARVAELVAIL